MNFSKTQALFDQLLEFEMSCGANAAIRERISATLESLVFTREQPVA